MDELNEHDPPVCSGKEYYDFRIASIFNRRSESNGYLSLYAVDIVNNSIFTAVCERPGSLIEARRARNERAPAIRAYLTRA